MKIKTDFILDCSVTMTWCFKEEADRLSQVAQTALIQNRALVPSIWPLEVNNVLWAGIRTKKITEIQAKRFKYILKDLPIIVDLKASDLSNDVILELAQVHKISCYDAAYLELCIREHLPIATLDKALAKAAKNAGVALLS
jgi:predicted nucleic acid-binding protein